MNSQRKYYKKLYEDKTECRNDIYYRDENYYRDATYYHEHEKRCDSEMPTDEGSNYSYRGASNHHHRHHDRYEYGASSNRSPRRLEHATGSDHTKHISKITTSSCFQDSCISLDGHRTIDDGNCSGEIVHSPPQLRRHRIRNHHGEELRSPLATVDNNTYDERDCERRSESVQNYPLQARQHRRRLALSLLDEISNMPLGMSRYETIGPPRLNIHRFRLPDAFHPYLHERKSDLLASTVPLYMFHIPK